MFLVQTAQTSVNFWNLILVTNSYEKFSEKMTPTEVILLLMSTNIIKS